jgi:Protein of unknown function with PCYCGC motif
MSKPSRKNPPQPPRAAPSSSTNRSKTPIVLGVAVVAAIAVGALALMRTDPAQPVGTSAAATTPAGVPPVDAVPAVALKPHPQKELPPIDLPKYPLGRSPEVITAAYKFAAEHPEILTYVPCFCGCERSGHRGNEDCFVKTRAENGDVTEWEPHGMECNVCLDVATQAMQMHASGASVRDIRAAVEQKWAKQSQEMHTHTPTPAPPGK